VQYRIATNCRAAQTTIPGIAQINVRATIHRPANSGADDQD
jgi:hypothetical protein